MPMGKPKSTRSRPDAAEQRKINDLQDRMERMRESGRDQEADRLMDRIQNLAAEAYDKRKEAGYKRGGKVNRSNMNMQTTRGDKMDDENKNASKKKKSSSKAKAKGVGAATKGVRKAKIY